MASPNEPDAPNSLPGEAQWTYRSRSPEETCALADRIAKEIRGGEIILLRGELGAGKTCFAAAFAKSLGIAEPIVSPTYILLRSYETPNGLTLHHLDFYRLEGTEDIDTIGIEELIGPDCVVLVEWPERCPEAFPSFTLELQFQISGDEERTIEGRPEAWGLRLGG